MTSLATARFYNRDNLDLADRRFLSRGFPPFRFPRSRDVTSSAIQHPHRVSLIEGLADLFHHLQRADPESNERFRLNKVFNQIGSYVSTRYRPDDIWLAVEQAHTVGLPIGTRRHRTRSNMF